jgi:DNA-binding Lrp family transcriptional regulator
MPEALLDEQDWRLIRAMTEDLPLAPRPFRGVAEEVGESEDRLLARVDRLLKAGVIRRFGATLKHYAVGFHANAMVVWRVDQPRVSEVGKLFAGFDSVSHCYERNTYPSWPYNLYTMIHCRTREECFEVADRLALAAGVGPEDFELLFTKRELKKDRMRYGG